MKDERKTKRELIAELEELRGENAELRQHWAVEDGAADIALQMAVERVRSEAMAMKTSGDLAEVVTILHKQMVRVGVQTKGCNIAFISDDARQLINYFTTTSPPEIEYYLSSPERYPNCEVIEEGARLRATTTYDLNFDLAGKQWESAVRAWREQEPDTFPFQDRYIYNIPFKYGIIGLQEYAVRGVTIDIVRELAESLSLGYVRFLDFQQLEQQAEQARRERAVERVRAEAMAMRTSDDLLKVVGAVMRELQTLGVDTEICAITFVDEESKINHSFQAFISPQVANIAWKSAELVAIDERIAVSRLDYPFEKLAGWLEKWKRGDVWQSELDSEFMAFRAKEYSQAYGLDGLFPFTERDTVCLDVPYSLGTIAVWVPENRDELVDMIRQFTVGVELGYMRYLDIQKVDEAQRQLIDELEEELQTAHTLQTGLMSIESPQVGGFDIAGRCISANHVGGDFFQYFPQDDKLAICLADVTGHAMEAAVPMIMFSGVLKTEMRHGAPLDELFGQFNRIMHQSFDKRTYVCCGMVELDLADRTLQFANSGCPYPFHYHASTGEVAELQIDAYPLGVRTETVYKVIETRLEKGDYLVFCSDGIIEAANATEDLFGFEQTAVTVQQACADGLAAEALIGYLIDSVQRFVGDEPQRDDMTCVVLRVEK